MVLWCFSKNLRAKALDELRLVFCNTSEGEGGL
jgi:hypothetical protein